MSCLPGTLRRLHVNLTGAKVKEEKNGRGKINWVNARVNDGLVSGRHFFLLFSSLRLLLGFHLGLQLREFLQIRMRGDDESSAKKLFQVCFLSYLLLPPPLSIRNFPVRSSAPLDEIPLFSIHDLAHSPVFGLSFPRRDIPFSDRLSRSETEKYCVKSWTS